MQSLDSYREKSFVGFRIIELFDDRIVVSGRKSFKLTIKLATLEPTINNQEIQEKIRLPGALLFVLGTAVAISWKDYPPIYENAGFWVTGFFALFGLYMFRRSFRRIETVVFFNTKGVNQLSISKIGPDVLRFQDFVDRIITQIKLCRAGR